MLRYITESTKEFAFIGLPGLSWRTPQFRSGCLRGAYANSGPQSEMARG
jgi:hypothetical protein